MARGKKADPVRSDHEIVVTTYEELGDDLKVFDEGKINFIVLLGNAGVGKSEYVKKFVKNTIVIDTKLTAFDLYGKLFDNIDSNIIIDDVPDLFRNADTLAILKALTDTRKEKTVSWNTRSCGGQNQLPQSFQTRSRLIIIVNEWRSINENVKSLETRGVVMRFDPTPAEVHLEVARAGWFHDQEVFDFMYEHLRLVAKPSFRHYVGASEQRKAGRPWRKRALEWLIGDSRLRFILGAMYDGRYATDTERGEAFVQAGHGSIATYWRLLKDVKRYPRAKTVLAENPKLEKKRALSIHSA